jgi:hypothetical protein
MKLSQAPTGNLLETEIDVDESYVQHSCLYDEYKNIPIICAFFLVVQWNSNTLHDRQILQSHVY